MRRQCMWACALNSILCIFLKKRSLNMFHKNPHISHHYKATALSSFYSVLEGYTPYGKPVVG